MTVNNNKKDTHIYNIINNPPKVFTEPCEACGVSEFQLGVKHAEERIIKLLEAECCELDDCRCQMGVKWAIALIKREQKPIEGLDHYAFIELLDKGEQK